jgi:hypothetical protein
MRLFFLCVLLLMPAAGCGRSASAVIRIEFERSGADAIEMDQMVALPLLNAINGAPDVADIQAMSFVGRTQIFVTSSDGHSIEVVSQRVHDALTSLPSDCRLLAIDQLKAGENIPAGDAGESEQLKIDIKPNSVLRELGVSSADVKEAIAQVMADVPQSKDLENFKKQPWCRRVQLHEVADIQVLKAPKRITCNLAGKR